MTISNGQSDGAPARPGRAFPTDARAAIVIAAVAVAAAGVFVFKVSGKMPDFDVYLLAGERAAAAEPLYRVEDGHYQFKYLPAFAILVAPLSALDHSVARALWFALSIALVPALLAVSVRLMRERRKAAWILVAAAVVVMGKFYARELVLGQVNLLFAVVAVAALVAIDRGRQPLAGGLVAVAIVLKPYGVLLLPWLVARRQPQAAATALVGLVAALLLPSALYGVGGTIDLHRAWWETVLSTTAPNLVSPDNVSWQAMYTRWLGPGPWAGALTIVTVVGAMAVAAWVWRYRRGIPHPDGLEGALMLLAIPFLSPQGWDYVLLVATPAVIYLANYEDRLPAALRWLTLTALAIVGLTIYDLMGRAAYHAFMMHSGITLCFVVVIAALVALRVRGVA